MESIVTNLDLFVILQSLEKTCDYNLLFEAVVSRLNCSLSEEDQMTLREFCRRFVNSVAKRWKSAHRKMELFRQDYGSWLEAEVDWPSCIKENVPEPQASSTEQEEGASASISEPSTSVGTMTKRKYISKIPFEELGSKQKKRRSSEYINSESSELLHAAISKMKQTGQENFASVIEHLLKHPETVEKFHDLIKKPLTTFTPQKALGLLISLHLSKWQYMTLRESAIREGLKNMYPSYYRIQKEKQECYPPEPKKYITVTDSSARITLQAILDLTAKRISKTLPENIQNKQLQLISKWGFDGASSQSRYKQKMDSAHDDSSIFMTSLAPLKMTCEGATVWENPKPCSAAFCRPVQFTFVKESEAVVKEEEKRIKNEIEFLRPSVCESNTIDHKLMLTMVDGKICTYLSDAKSSATCYLCLTKPSEMNKLTEVKVKPISENMMELGLSPLHARINMMQCLLHIAYRLDFKKSAARDADQELMKQRQKMIQNRFKEDLNLLIDVVKQGHGTTNDGNTARRFFEFPDKTAEITGLDIELIRRFVVILQTITSGEHIKVEKFKEYTWQTAERFVSIYGWYNMPVTVHKILIHGAEIIAHNAIVPIGSLSEEASEARNKDFRRLREHHSRKKSRVCSNEDIFNFLLLYSDPLISATRPTMDAKKKKALFEEVWDLLNIQEPDNQIEFCDITNLDPESSDSDSISSDDDSE